MAQTERKTAFVFSGGGSLGAIQVGMLRALLASGVCPDFVVGASVGAINAAYFACAPDLDGMAALQLRRKGARPRWQPCQSRRSRSVPRRNPAVQDKDLWRAIHSLN